MPGTFNTLVDRVMIELNRTDAETRAQVENFVNDASEELCNAIENVGFSRYVQGVLVPGLAVYAKPGRWRSHLSFKIGTGAGFTTTKILELRDYLFMDNYWPDRTQNSEPLFYGDYGYDNYLISPTPDLAYPFEIGYLELPPPLSAINQTNWLTDFAYSTLFYKVMTYTAPYLRDPERIQEWQKYAQDGINALNNRDGSRKLDRGSIRTAD